MFLEELVDRVFHIGVQLLEVAVAGFAKGDEALRRAFFEAVDGGGEFLDLPDCLGLEGSVLESLYAPPDVEEEGDGLSDGEIFELLFYFKVAFVLDVRDF